MNDTETKNICGDSHGNAGAPKSVFIVEDEGDLLDLYVETLKLDGHDVVGFARNGDEAVRNFKTLPRRPDIIIMDHRMPVKNGIDASKEILRIDPSASIIFASADLAVEPEALEAGAVKFMKKPFDLAALLDSLDSLD